MSRRHAVVGNFVAERFERPHGGLRTLVVTHSLARPEECRYYQTLSQGRAVRRFQTELFLGKSRHPGAITLLIGFEPLGAYVCAIEVFNGMTAAIKLQMRQRIDRQMSRKRSGIARIGN